MKKLSAILLLFVLIFSINGSFFIFKTLQWQIRKEVKKQIKSGVPETKLHVFSFTENEWKHIHWFEKGKEFSKNGKMYDIVRTKKAGEIITVLCVNDEEEAQLFAHLDEMVNKTLSAGATAHSPLQKILKLALNTSYVFHTQNENQIHFTYLSENHSVYKNFYQNPELKFTSPPPNKF